MTKAHYTHSYTRRWGQSFLLIVDLKSGHQSVTNELENIIPEIVDEDRIDIRDHIILYRDEQSIWDCYDHLNETFHRVGRADLDTAIDRYLLVYQSRNAQFLFPKPY